MDDWMNDLVPMNFSPPPPPQNSMMLIGQDQHQLQRVDIPIGQALHPPSDNMNPVIEQYSYGQGYPNQPIGNYSQQNYQNNNYQAQNFTQQSYSNQGYQSHPNQGHQQYNYQDNSYGQSDYSNYNYSQQTSLDQHNFSNQNALQGNMIVNFNGQNNSHPSHFDQQNYSQTEQATQQQPQPAPVTKQNFPGQEHNFQHANYPAPNQYLPNYSNGDKVRQNYSQYRNQPIFSDQNNYQPNLSERNFCGPNPSRLSVSNPSSSVRSSQNLSSQPNFVRHNFPPPNESNQPHIHSSPSEQTWLQGYNSSQRQPLATQMNTIHSVLANIGRQENTQPNNSGPQYNFLSSLFKNGAPRSQPGQERHQQSSFSNKHSLKQRTVEGDLTIAQNPLPENSTGEPHLQSTPSSQDRPQQTQRQENQEKPIGCNRDNVATVRENKNFSRDCRQLTQKRQDLQPCVSFQETAVHNAMLENENYEGQNHLPPTRAVQSHSQRTHSDKNRQTQTSERSSTVFCAERSSTEFLSAQNTSQESQGFQRHKLPGPVSSEAIRSKNQGCPQTQQRKTDRSQSGSPRKRRPAQNARQEDVTTSFVSNWECEPAGSKKNKPQTNKPRRTILDVLDEDEPVMFDPRTMSGLVQDHFNERICDLLDWTTEDMTKYYNTAVPAQNRALNAKREAETQRKLQEKQSETQASKPPSITKYIKIRDTRPKMNMQELPKKDPYGNDFVTCSEYPGSARYYLVKFSCQEEEKPKETVEHRVKTREEAEKELLKARAKTRPLEERFPRLSKLVMKPSIFETMTTTTIKTVKRQTKRRKIISQCNNQPAKRRKDNDQRIQNDTEKEFCQNDEEIARALQFEEEVSTWSQTQESTNIETIQIDDVEIDVDPDVPCCSKSLKF